MGIRLEILAQIPKASRASSFKAFSNIDLDSSHGGGTSGVQGKKGQKTEAADVIQSAI